MRSFFKLALGIPLLAFVALVIGAMGASLFAADLARTPRYVPPVIYETPEVPVAPQRDGCVLVEIKMKVKEPVVALPRDAFERCSHLQTVIKPCINCFKWFYHVGQDPLLLRGKRQIRKIPASCQRDDMVFYDYPAGTQAIWVPEGYEDAVCWCDKGKESDPSRFYRADFVQ